MVKFLDLVDQYHRIKPEIDTAISEVIENSAFINGPFAAKFEKSFAEYLGAGNCVGVANGTDALEIAIEALELPKEAEILVPANSFIASAEAVSRNGHKVVFVDVDPVTYNISSASAKAKLTDRTAALVAVHLYGHPCDMGDLTAFAKTHGLRIVEDCAQAHGAEYKGSKIGTLGDVAAFSFYPGKNLGAYGDAGAIVTNDDALALKARKIANHGRVAKYDHEFEGRNSRLDGIQAAVLQVKLKYLENWISTRIAIADFYNKNLQGVGDLVLPVRQGWARHAYHLYVVRTAQRDELKKFLEGCGIESGVHYPIALPKLKAFEYANQAHEDMFANRTDHTLLSLPIGDHLSLAEAERVVKAVRAFYV